MSNEANLNLHWIKCAYKTVCRGGNFLIDVFKKQDKKLTGEECMKLKDWYGIRPEDIVKLSISHSFTIDDEAFARLLDEDDARAKTIKALNYEKKDCDQEEKKITCFASG